MDVRLSPEQEALRHSAAQIVGRLGPKAVGELDDLERTARLDAAVDVSGWRELRGPTEQGLPLASGVEPAIIAAELGRGLADVSFLGPTLAAELRRLAGAPPAESSETVGLDATLGSLVSAGELGSLALIAIDAYGCDHALFLTPDSDGYRLARIELGSSRSSVDLTRPSVVVSSLAGAVAVEGSSRLTTEDIDRWTALGLALTSADLAGGMEGAVQLACEYAKERKQYGAAIGSFQAVQHLLADAFVLTEGAHSISRYASWAVDALSASEALSAAAAAKAYSARAARTVCETVVQVHGGVGNTWECLAHVYLRRALLSSDICGNADASLGRVLAHHGIGGDYGLR